MVWLKTSVCALLWDKGDFTLLMCRVGAMFIGGQQDIPNSQCPLSQISKMSETAWHIVAPNEDVANAVRKDVEHLQQRIKRLTAQGEQRVRTKTRVCTEEKKSAYTEQERDALCHGFNQVACFLQQQDKDKEILNVTVETCDQTQGTLSLNGHMCEQDSRQFVDRHNGAPLQLVVRQLSAYGITVDRVLCDHVKSCMTASLIEGDGRELCKQVSLGQGYCGTVVETRYDLRRPSTHSPKKRKRATALAAR